MRSPIIPEKDLPKTDQVAAGEAAAPSVASTVLEDKPPRWFARFDVFLLLMLLTLVLFLGSYAANNSDIHMSLATGKLLASLDYQFGVDPFAFTTKDVYWANHSWLSSLIFYVVQSAGGDGGLVLFKALLLVVLALVMLKVRERSVSLVLALFFVALALVAASPRFLLQSTVFSFLFLGVTLYLLHRGGMLDRTGSLTAEPERTKVLWLIPVLCVAWVNLDAWFILGPLALGLVWGGNGLASFLGQKSAVPLVLQSKIFGLSVVACVLNPHHIRAFALPPELAYLLLNITGVDALPDWLVGGGRAWHGIVAFDGGMSLMSPLNPRYLEFPALGGNVAGLSFIPLVLLGLASFVLLALMGNKAGAPQPQVGRLFLWLALGILAVAMARLTPFFAIVAGPLTALNFGEFLAWRHSQATDGIDWRYGRLARLLTFVGLAATLFLAWPGWLHTSPGTSDAARRVAWAIVVDPSMQQAAQKLGQLKAAGKAENIFNMSTDLGNYCARFAPGVKCFFDNRANLFPRTMDAFGRTRRLLARDAEAKLTGKQGQGLGGDWAKVFRQLGIDHVVLTQFDQDRARDREMKQTYMAHYWWTQPHDWTMRYVDGRTLIFAWRGDQPTRPDEDEIATWPPRAFGKNAEQVPPLGPLPPDPPGELDTYLRTQGPLALDVNRAALYHGYFVMASEAWKPFYLHAWQATLWAGQAGAGPAMPGGVWGPANLLFMLGVPQGIMASQTYSGRPALRSLDFGPAELPVLMVRAARRGLAENPHQPEAYLMLANAYMDLWKKQEEVWANYHGRDNPNFRSSLRQAQILYGMRNFLLLEPDNSKVHLQFAELLESINYLDAALEHLEKGLTYLRPDGRDPNSLQAYRAKKNHLEKTQKSLAEEIRRRDRYYNERAIKLQGAARAKLAFRDPFRWTNAENKDEVDPRGMGLVNKALEYLDSYQQQPAGKGNQADRLEALFLQLHLLINLGRAAEVYDALPSLKDKLGLMYPTVAALSAAAVGDYALLEESLAALEKQSEPRQVFEKIGTSLASGLGLYQFNPRPGLDTLVHFQGSMPFYQSLQQMMAGYNDVVRQHAEMRLLRGLAALERGAVPRAQELLSSALTLTGPRAHFPDGAIATRYLELLKRQP